MTTTQEQKLTYAKRFNIALDLYGVAPRHQGRSLSVGDIFGLTQRGAARWVNGEVLPPKARRRAIAAKLDIDFNWLEYGHGEPRASFCKAESVRRFPVITQMEAINHQEVLTNFTGRRITFETAASKESFAIEVVGSAMDTFFKPGTIVLIDPTLNVSDGDFILVYVDKISEVLLRRYVLGDSGTHLVPLCEKFTSMQLDKTDQIIGVVFEAKQVFK